MSENTNDIKIQNRLWYEIIILLAAIATIIGFVVSGIFSNPKDALTENENISDNEITYVEQATNIMINEINYTTNITTNTEITDELGQAKLCMLHGEYDEALMIYEKDVYADCIDALVNLGYIYANGLSYKGTDIQKAVDLYMKANCTEASHNLLALFLKSRDKDAAEILLNRFIEVNDTEVISYLQATLLIDDVLGEKKISTDATSKLIEALYEWEYTDNRYNGYNPPADTFSSRWIIQGIDTAEDRNVNHPYLIYREQIRVFIKNIEMLEKVYFTEDGILTPYDLS